MDSCLEFPASVELLEHRNGLLSVNHRRHPLTVLRRRVNHTVTHTHTHTQTQAHSHANPLRFTVAHLTFDPTCSTHKHASPLKFTV